MAKKSELLTSAKFAKKTGLTTAAVSKLIRDGKIKATKKSGKWMIDPDQLNVKAVKAASKDVKAASKTGKPKAKKKAAKPKPEPQKAAAKPPKAAQPKVAEPQAEKPATGQKSYSIAEFAGMTYLTEKGVAEWLKSGRLTGSQDAQGAWRIDAANLEASLVKRLVR